MKYISCILKINFYRHIGRFKLLTGHYPRSEQKTWPLFISILINILALACVDVLFTEAEPANGNTSDTFDYEKLDESKTRYLICFDVFWITKGGHACDINSKEGKRRTAIKRLKTLRSNFIIRLTLDIVDSYYGTKCCIFTIFLRARE